jgi:hypothetical protein
VNQHATKEEAVFSVGATRGYITRISFSSGVDSCNRELREAPELAVGRIMARKELGCEVTVRLL